MRFLGTSGAGMFAGMLAVVGRASDTTDGSASPYAKYYTWDYSNLTVCTLDAARNLTQELESCTFLDDDSFIGVERDGECASCAILCPKGEVNHIPDGTTYTILHSDAGHYFESIGGLMAQAKDEGSVSITTTAQNSFYDAWQDLDAINAHIREKVGGTNGKMTIEQLEPPTHENRRLMAVRLRGENWTPGRPRVVVTFLLHAREWISAMAGAYVIEQIAQRVMTEPDFFADVELVIIPISNPDGFAHTAHGDRFWRKNRRTHSADPAEQCGDKRNGVDLNRNWDKAWGQGCDGRSCSVQKCSDTYIGAAPHSEPEVQAIMSVMDEASMSVHLDIHAFSQVILTPWGYTNEAYSMHTEAMELGSRMADAMKAVNGNVYRVGPPGSLLYTASGGAQDYSTDKGALGFTYELPPATGGMQGFAPPASAILPAGRETLPGIYAAVEWAEHAAGSNILSGSRSVLASFFMVPLTFSLLLHSEH